MTNHGAVRGAYRIDRWYSDGPSRWCFEGTPVSELDVVGTLTDEDDARKTSRTHGAGHEKPPIPVRDTFLDSADIFSRVRPVAVSRL